MTLSLVLHKMSDACPFLYSSSIFYDIMHMLVAIHMTHAPIWAVNTVDSGPHLPGSGPQYAARRMSIMKEHHVKCRLYISSSHPQSADTGQYCYLTFFSLLFFVWKVSSILPVKTVWGGGDLELFHQRRYWPWDSLYILTLWCPIHIQENGCGAFALQTIHSSSLIILCVSSSPSF